MNQVFVKCGRFFRHSWFVKLWFLPVWLGLGVSKFLIFSLSFKRLVPMLGQSVGVAPWIPLTNLHQVARGRQISAVVQMAARYTPWNSNCFPQAIVARCLLGLYGLPYCLFFGVRRNSKTGAFDAHAWVVSGRVKVTGGYSFRTYTVVGVLASPALASLVTQDCSCRSPQKK